MSEDRCNALEEVIRNWVRAEFMFRSSDRAYTAETQEWLLEAEDRLRQIVTGHTNLLFAGDVVGVNALTVPKVRVRKKARAKRTRVRSKVKGLF